MKTKHIILLVLDITLRGGIERFIANLATLFNTHGFKVTVYSFHKTHDKPLYEFPERVTIIYLTNYKLRRLFYKLVTLICCIWFALARRNNDDAVIISPYPITTIFLALLSRNIAKSVISSEHSTYQGHGKLVRALRLLAYRLVKNSVTQTNDGVTQFRSAGIRKVTKIPNSVTDFSDERQWQLIPRTQGKPFICLSVARFDQVKQLEHFIEVARLVSAKCPHVQFQLVGSGPCEAHLRSLITNSCLQEILRIYAPTKFVNNYYATASAYVVTSKSEAFPMTVIEALSYGVPVFSYDGLVGPKEIIANGVNGFLCRQDSPIAIADKLIDYYRFPENFYDMRACALRSAKTFHETEIFKLWLSII